MSRGPQSPEQIADTEVKRQSFHKSLFNLHKEIGAIKKTEGNPFFKSNYVSLPVMLDIVKPLAQKHGFFLSQPVDIINTQAGARNAVASILVHAETGLSETAKLMIDEETDAQKLGGKITYFRRYTLSSLLGLQEIDDDGNTASGKKPAKKAGVKSKDNF